MGLISCILLSPPSAALSEPRQPSGRKEPRAEQLWQAVLVGGRLRSLTRAVIRKATVPASRSSSVCRYSSRWGRKMRGSEEARFF